MLKNLDSLVNELRREVDYLRHVVEPSGAMAALEAAAAEVVAAARAHGGFDLDLCDAFRGLVLEAAVRSAAGRSEAERLREAFDLLGKGAVVKQRNQYAVRNRERQKIEALRAALSAAETKSAGATASANTCANGKPVDIAVPVEATESAGTPASTAASTPPTTALSEPGASEQLLLAEA